MSRGITLCRKHYVKDVTVFYGIHTYLLSLIIGSTFVKHFIVYKALLHAFLKVTNMLKTSFSKNVFVYTVDLE